MLWVAEHFNIKPNWAWAAYKQRSGAYPPGLVNVPIMPDVSLIRWALEGRLGWCEANEATYSAKHCRECLDWLDQQPADAIAYQSELAWQKWLASVPKKPQPIAPMAKAAKDKPVPAKGSNIIRLADHRKAG
jgi:hypothetical protein